MRPHFCQVENRVLVVAVLLGDLTPRRRIGGFFTGAGSQDLLASRAEAVPARSSNHIARPEACLRELTATKAQTAAHLFWTVLWRTACQSALQRLE
jgi:hypothetical protein